MKTQKETIEFETLTVRVPKRVMDFLRKIQSGSRVTPQQYAEQSIIEMVEADMQVM